MHTSAAPVVHRPADLAAQLKVHVTTIYRLIASGQLPAYRVGRCLRVPDESVKQFRLPRSGDQAAAETAVS